MQFDGAGEPIILEKAVRTRSREVRESFSMRYRRLSVRLEGDWVNAINPTVFLRVLRGFA
jgi:hypothetical protein